MSYTTQQHNVLEEIAHCMHEDAWSHISAHRGVITINTPKMVGYADLQRHLTALQLADKYGYHTTGIPEAIMMCGVEWEMYTLHQEEID